jgi:hypothetical protein
VQLHPFAFQNTRVFVNIDFVVGGVDNIFLGTIGCCKPTVVAGTRNRSRIVNPRRWGHWSSF